MNHKFHTVDIKNIFKESEDSISVEFNIPEELKPKLRYRAGQYLTIRTFINGDNLQRPYSICTAPYENSWKIAIKETANGLFSQYALSSFRPGQSVDIMGPEGCFTIDTHPDNEKNYVFFAAGSGITPVISLIKDILKNETKSRVHLFFGNKKYSSTMFYDELQALKQTMLDRFSVQYFFSQQPVNDQIYYGRLNKEKIILLSEKMLLDISGTDEFFLCGPEKMVADLNNLFIERGVPKEKIHIELFESSAGNQLKYKEKTEEDLGEFSEVTVTLDGEDHVIEVPYDDLPIIEYVLDEGLPAPFSCLGGVCCSCRAKLLEGEVEMMANFALDDDEVEEGYRLTCQSLPRSKKIHLDYDQ